MIFVYSDDIKNFELNSFDKNNLFILDCNLKNNNFLRSKFYKNYKNKEFNYIKYIKVYNDIKYNSLYSCYKYCISKNYFNNITLFFDTKKNCKDYAVCADCIISFPKRIIIKKLLKDIVPIKKIFLDINQIQKIFFLSSFLIKTKVINRDKNFFDFVFNYYFYLNEE
jgi:hypothetical protein